MFSAKKGFVLTDALCSVLIVAVLVSFVSAAVTLSLRSREASREAVRELETGYEMMFLQQQGCDISCEEDADPSS